MEEIVATIKEIENRLIKLLNCKSITDDKIIDFEVSLLADYKHLFAIEDLVENIDNLIPCTDEYEKAMHIATMKYIENWTDNQIKKF